MRRSLRAIIVVLGQLALLGACFEIAPRSSLPFQPLAERQTRYAAEMTLAVKEDRRGEASEALANGRMVLPQRPEIWGLPAPGPSRAALSPDAGQLEPSALAPPGDRAASAAPIGCAGLTERPGVPPPPDCHLGSLARSFAWPIFGYATILPAAAPRDAIPPQRGADLSQWPQADDHLPTPPSGIASRSTSRSTAPRPAPPDPP